MLIFCWLMLPAILCWGHRQLCGRLAPLLLAHVVCHIVLGPQATEGVWKHEPSALVPSPLRLNGSLLRVFLCAAVHNLRLVPHGTDSHTATGRAPSACKNDYI